jgi:hypothetical protein
MRNFYESVIETISKPTESRNDNEIDFILNWFLNLFRKKSIFGDVTQGTYLSKFLLNLAPNISKNFIRSDFLFKDVVKDLIKNCQYESKKRDDLIISQGDIGDW